MTLLLLVRHGQASFGAADYDQLSDLGHRQADLVAQRLLALGLDAPSVVSGSLVRQRDTARHLGAVLDPDNEIPMDPRLDEYDPLSLGAYTELAAGPPETERQRRRDFQDALDRSLARWIDGGTAGGESHAEFVTRVESALRQFAEGGRPVVATTSAGVIAVAVAGALGLPWDRWPAVARVMVNTSVTKLLTSPSGLQLLSFNDHAHLETDATLRSYR